MITINRNAADTALNPLAMSRPASLSNSQNSSNSFAQQLVSALEGYLSQHTDASHIDIAIDAQPGQNSGTRQFLVTVRDSPALPVITPLPAAPAPVVSSKFATQPTAVANSVSPVPSAPAAAEAGPPITSETDAYWALEPKEVQALRTIQDYKERHAKAQDLIHQGFSIDSDIMVYGDDPYITMRYRQDMGYTWIPAAGQPNIPVAPGLKFPGLPSYDPLQQPPGSIKVSTDFVKGFEATIPCGGVAWIKNA